MRIISFLFKAVVVIALLVGALFGLARFHDGPISMIPGGPLESGEWVDGLVPDWSFARSIPTIELQLEGDDTSRTVWILVRGDDAYIPCSLGFPPGKEWHLRADENGEAVLRIEGKRYPVHLKRLVEERFVPELEQIASLKYGGGPPGDSEIWFFSVRSRAR